MDEWLHGYYRYITKFSASNILDTFQAEPDEYHNIEDNIEMF